MGDEQVGEVALRLQLAEQVDHLRLHAHVEGRGRLVQHDEGRRQHEGARHRDALALPAGELVRIAMPRRWVEPDVDQRLGGAAIALLEARARLVHLQPFGDDVADRHARAERAIGVLEDYLEVAPERLHRLPRPALHLLAEHDDAALGVDQAQECKAERRLAGSRFAHHPQRLAAPHLNVDAVHRLDVADGPAQQPALDREPHLQVRRFDDDGRRPVRLRRVALRLGREQLARIGVLRPREHLFDRPVLDDLALRHHADAVGDAPDDAEVVGDEQDRHAEARLQLLQERQDLRLHGDVERRRRLVCDEQLRLIGERHGDHHALALAAGELVRIGAEAARRVGNADLFEKLDGPRPRRRAAEAAMHRENLADLPLDGVQRVERTHRLLEHHGDVVAAHPPQRPLVGLQHVLAVEDDLAGGMAGGRIGQQADDRQCRHRLAGPGFADDRQRLAPPDLEGDVVDRQRRGATLVECNGEIADGEEGRGHGNWHVMSESGSRWRWPQRRDRSAPCRAADGGERPLKPPLRRR